MDFKKDLVSTILPFWLKCIDYDNGGIFTCADREGNVYGTDKSVWFQCEAMIALRMAHDIFGEDKYLDAYNALKKLCEECFVDAQCGEWYGYLHYDNTPSTTLKGNIFKGPFHIPRFYMVMSAMDDGDVMKYFNV